MNEGINITLKTNETLTNNLNDSLNNFAKSINNLVNSSKINYPLIDTSSLVSIMSGSISSNLKYNELNKSITKFVQQVARTFNSRLSDSNIGFMSSMIHMAKMQQDIIKPISEMVKVLSSTINNMNLPTNEELSLIIDTIASRNFQEYGVETIDEAKTIVRETLNEACIENDNMNWQQSFKNKTDKFSEKNPVYAKLIDKIFWLLFAYFIFNPSMAYSKEQISEAFNKTKVTANYTLKDARNEVKSAFNGFDSQTKAIASNFFRYIKQDNVPLRTSKSMNGFIIGTLTKGDVVEIINKERNWINIKFENENGEIITGWTNTIYTERIFNSTYK